MSERENPTLPALQEAIQAFANSLEDEPAVVLASVVVFETTRYDDDGRQLYAIRYAIPSDGTGLSASIGLLDAAHVMLRRDAIEDDDE